MNVLEILKQANLEKMIELERQFYELDDYTEDKERIDLYKAFIAEVETQSIPEGSESTVTKIRIIQYIRYTIRIPENIINSATQYEVFGIDLDANPYAIKFTQWSLLRSCEVECFQDTTYNVLTGELKEPGYFTDADKNEIPIAATQIPVCRRLPATNYDIASIQLSIDEMAIHLFNEMTWIGFPKQIEVRFKQIKQAQQKFESGNTREFIPVEELLEDIKNTGDYDG